MTSSGGTPQRAVVFHQDRFLAEAVLDFCVRALRAGDPLILIATSDHRREIAGRLVARGYSWEGACRAGRAVGYDAEALLARFSVDGLPDRTRFLAVMEEVLAPWSELGTEQTVRAFGEMVDLLCQREQPAAAARLEELWTELARSHRFTLLCAYSMGNLYREVNGSGYRRTIDAHDHVATALPEPSGHARAELPA